MLQMNNPPLTQSQILSLCRKDDGFSILSKHAHFSNHIEKLGKLLDKGLIRLSKRLGDNGGVFKAVCLK